MVYDASYLLQSDQKTELNNWKPVIFQILFTV